MGFDKETERQRYDARASEILASNDFNETELSNVSGIDLLPAALSAPYLYYEEQIENHLKKGQLTVLEIGAGIGLYTGLLFNRGGHICATDISEASLNVLKKRFHDRANLETKVADMESLPFNTETIDVVVCAGSLSYGNNQKVMSEIYRVLKRKGVFICVDSLNHNPIFRINRWFHYLRGNRTLSTLKRMPTLALIDAYEKKFGAVTAQYYGAILWLNPLLNKIFSEKKVVSIINHVDKIFAVRKSAFKFVMVVKKVK